MALQIYEVSYSTNGSTWTALTNVQNINFNAGRVSQLDQIKTGTATVEMRYPTGYASPITALVSGTQLRIRNVTPSITTKLIWTGFISDVGAQYGIPYAGGVGQADFLTIQAEGSFARFGRMQGNNYAMAAGNINTQVASSNAQTGLTLQVQPLSTVDPTPVFNGDLGATTVSSTWGDWVARVCQTLNARLWELGNNAIIVSPFATKALNPPSFSDVSNVGNIQKYNQISFDSLADNYYTQVTVTPEGFSAATVTQAGATTPYRAYQTNTLNASTSQATDFANYLLANYGTARFAISSFTCSAEAQAQNYLDFVGWNTDLTTCAGTQVAVTFRGTIYQCLVEGVRVSATPAGAVYTFFVSGADLNSYLILDNATFGKLDSNRLAY
jgi:hypothetical protein